ncbi:unnamed protein product [Vitrella brassicaformis CCMP3155]|uniref:Uncharacterized protein n=1 Tax=Vitrella brassicaformis (strain CCMP3155) TaxID=1169540 RepID=A0A0G4FGA6_VITBC|nr:unnamed protein product [Vitrella brassicaformis CCMP3155]|eukprot:CEM11863.1 unnamed protein product [Vitrella brassicaformis CCMP3155]
MMIWLLRWWTSGFSYRRVADHRQLLSTSTEEDDSSTQLSVVIGGAGADQGLPADVFARVVIPLLPVDDAVRLRAVGKAYGAQLIDEAFLLSRINSCLAQQQLTGLIDVERDRGADPSAPPLPPSLSRIGYLARCAYVIERAAEWRHMATFIRVAGACGVAGQLPVVLSAETVAAHVPDKATFHRLPATMAVYKTLGDLLGSGADNGSQQLQLTDGGRREIDVFVVPTNMLLRVVHLASYFIYLLALGWAVVHGVQFLACVIVDALDHLERLDITYRVVCQTGIVIFSMFLGGLIGVLIRRVTKAIWVWVHARKRMVQHYDVGERTLRIIGRDEMFCFCSFLWRCSSTHGDPPIQAWVDIFPTFSSFALHTLLGAPSSSLRFVLKATVSGRHAGYRRLRTDNLSSGRRDVVVIDWRWDFKFWEAIRMVVLLVGGGSVAASVLLSDGGRIMVGTTEVAVADGYVDEDFPATTAAVRELLRPYGLGDLTFRPWYW